MFALRLGLRFATFRLLLRLVRVASGVNEHEAQDLLSDQSGVDGILCFGVRPGLRFNNVISSSSSSVNGARLNSFETAPACLDPFFKNGTHHLADSLLEFSVG